MYENELAIYAFNLQILRRFAGELNPEHLGRQINGQGQTPRWILGHLAIATDYATQLLGGKGTCSPQWHEFFGPGSAIIAEGAPSPGTDELLKAVVDGHERVIALAPRADAAALGAPPPLPIFEGTPIKTCAHLLTHLLTSHEAYHIGQFSAWQRQTGVPALA